MKRRMRYEYTPEMHKEIQPTLDCLDEIKDLKKNVIKKDQSLWQEKKANFNKTYMENLKKDIENTEAPIIPKECAPKDN